MRDEVGERGYVVLALLVRRRKGYRGWLLTEIYDRVPRGMSCELSSVHYALKRLVRLGLVEVVTARGQYERAGDSYGITAEGLAVVAERVRLWLRLVEIAGNSMSEISSSG